MVEIFFQKEKNELIQANPKSSKFIKRLIGAREFLNDNESGVLD